MKKRVKKKLKKKRWAEIVAYLEKEGPSADAVRGVALFGDRAFIFKDASLNYTPSITGKCEVEVSGVLYGTMRV